MGVQMVNVSVLLAVYNGLPYLPEQLQSLSRQTVPFRLLVQDAGSTDGSADVLKDFAGSQPNVVFGANQGQHLGAPGNFLSMLQQTRGPAALCDQDDIWMPDRLEACLEALSRAEAQWGSDTPILVHSDLRVVSEDGSPIHESFFGHQKWNPEAASLQNLLVQNNVTGCSVLINEPLRQLASRHAKNSGIFMHDWFLAQTAAAFGHIVFVPRPLVSYRQHGDNAVGASTSGIPGRVLKALTMPEKAKKRILLNYTQAQSFLAYYGNALPDEAKNVVNRFLEIPRQPKWRRPGLLMRGNYLMQDPVLRLGQLLLT